MEELDISDSRSLTEETIRHIVELGNNIESLSISRCYGIAPVNYLNLAGCRHLKYLNVFGVMKEAALDELKSCLDSIDINKFLFSSIARPTVGIKRTSIWNERTRD